MGFLMSLKKQDKSISFAKIIKREDVLRYFKPLRQQKKGRIAGFFLEYLQDEGFPFRKDDFDKVYDASLNHKSKYDLYPDQEVFDDTLLRADESSDED